MAGDGCSIMNFGTTRLTKPNCFVGLFVYGYLFTRNGSGARDYIGQIIAARRSEHVQLPFD